MIRGKNPGSKKRLGSLGETAAIAYLKANRFTILETNYRTKISEIDIIAQDDDTICFIEVKTRRSLKKGLPKEAVTRLKQHKIIQGALWYIKTNKLHDKRIRFDVMEIFIRSEGIGIDRINLIKNAYGEA